MEPLRQAAWAQKSRARGPAGKECECESRLDLRLAAALPDGEAEHRDTGQCGRGRGLRDGRCGGNLEGDALRGAGVHRALDLAGGRGREGGQEIRPEVGARRDGRRQVERAGAGEILRTSAQRAAGIRDQGGVNRVRKIEHPRRIADDIGVLVEGEIIGEGQIGAGAERGAMGVDGQQIVLGGGAAIDGI